MGAARILAVDDEPGVLQLCCDVLEEAGHQVDTEAAVAPALERLRTSTYDLVVTDLRLSTDSGLDLLRQAREVAPPVPFIVLTAYPSIEGAVEAIRAGAKEFLPKPFDNDHLCQVVDSVLDGRISTGSSHGGGPDASGPTPLCGRSASMRQLQDLIGRAAPTEASVLILGESGTGKELAAHWVHVLSPRREREFASLDCSALPDDLLESELFGFERSTVNAAATCGRGLVEAAHGGTLFLDEITGLSAALQGKLLRVLEERRFRSVGGRELRPANFRVVAASSADLPAAVQTGAFREDLYFRLNVIPIHLPALRDRREDIPVLVESFMQQYAGQRPQPPTVISSDAIDALMEYPWPGNVRELRNTVERMVSLARGTEIGLADVPPEVRAAQVPGEPRDEGDAGSFRDAKQRTINGFERDYLHRVLSLHGGNVTRSARDSGMKRSAFQRLMKKHDLRSSSYRTVDRETGP